MISAALTLEGPWIEGDFISPDPFAPTTAHPTLGPACYVRISVGDREELRYFYFGRLFRPVWRDPRELGEDFASLSLMIDGRLAPLAELLTVMGDIAAGRLVHQGESAEIER